MKIVGLNEIHARIHISSMITLQKEGLMAMARSKVNHPPVGYLEQNHPPGSYHIKYGLMEGDDIWVVKIAGGPDGKPSSGIVIAMSTSTGKPVAVFQDDGFLTNLRTALAGRICAELLAPKNIKGIGVLGSGVQARMQIEYLKDITTCRHIFQWSRTASKAMDYKVEMESKGFTVHTVSSPQEVAEHCNFIVTTTASPKPLLYKKDIRPGTHITAIGADSPGKQELDPEILLTANRVIVDHKAQCFDHGECAHLSRQDLYQNNVNLSELGDLLVTKSHGREADTEITVADLTGVAVQDIQIAKSVLKCSH